VCRCGLGPFNLDTPPKQKQAQSITLSCPDPPPIKSAIRRRLVLVAATVAAAQLQTMRSTLAQPGSARPITVLLILLGAGGAMAQNATNYDDGDPHNPDPNLANQVCCDPDSGSRSSAPTTIACTDYPTGRVGRHWSGQTACLSSQNGGYPKTAAGVLP